MDALIKIVITGPESTAKSDLCAALAKHYNTIWIPEYARIYLEKNDGKYNYTTLQKIAKEHKNFQEQYLQKVKNNIVFIDTDLINYKIWNHLVFDKKDPWVESKIKAENDHKYLLTSPDIPWTPDPLRENPNNRELLFNLHKKHIENLKRPYQIINGLGNQRIINAIKATEQLLS